MDTLNMKELTLEEIKEIELGILVKFDEICRENNLEYSLAYGTMLGAVRHHGFIPWDDDIDVFMKRDDYEKFLKLKYQDEKFEVKSYRYSKNYYYPFSKMIDKSTYLCESWRAEKDMGVYIDIFPLDYCDMLNDKELKRIEKSVTIAYLLGHKFSHHKELSIKYFLKLFLLLVTYPFKRQIIRSVEKRCCKKKDGDYCSMLLQLGSANDFMKADLFHKTEDIDFENKVFKVYSTYDEILTDNYGNYMQLPPVEKRVSNHWFKAYRKG